MGFHEGEKAKLSLIRAARAYSRWAHSRVTEPNRRRFESAEKRLHRAAERWAMLLPPEKDG
jgi:hypothetical protein